MSNNIRVVINRDNVIQVKVDNLSASYGNMIKAVYDADGDGIVDGAESIITTIVAREPILKYSVVTISGYKADSSNLEHLNKIVGVAIEDIEKDKSGKVLVSGKVVNTAWDFQPNALLYLNGSEISIIPPIDGFLCQIGKAITTNTILVKIETCIKL